MPATHLWRSPGGENLGLAVDEIHIWRASLDHPPSVTERLAHALSADERARAERLRLEGVRRRFVAGRGMVRAILARYLDADPGRIRFAYGPRGKPELDAPFDACGLRFSIAHSHALLLCAVTRGRAVGVDLESLGATVDVDAIARRFFSSGESAALQSMPEPERLPAFLRGWTSKEAYLKATGQGLGDRLDTVEVALGRRPAMLVRVDGEADRAAGWELVELTPAPGYVGALVAEGRGWVLSCWEC